MQTKTRLLSDSVKEKTSEKTILNPQNQNQNTYLSEGDIGFFVTVAPF